MGDAGPGRWFRSILWLVWPIEVLLARIRLGPPQPDLDQRPHLLLANHRSLFDIAVGTSMCRRWNQRVAILVAARYFDRPLAGRILRGLGAVPVDPGTARATIRTARELLEAGMHVLIMPEGQIAPAGTPVDEIIEVNRGAAVLAARTGAPLFVGGIHGADAVWPPDARLPRLSWPWKRPVVTLTARPVSTDGLSTRALHSLIEESMRTELRRAVETATLRADRSS